MTTNDVDNIEEFLAHYGVKGMKWGVRKDRREGVSRKTDREARKDAEETARAKMFYGEGAGTRRKLINKSVEAKKNRDPDYAKAFDRHIGEQDLSKHSEKAKSERKRTDRKKTARQSAGMVARKFTGEMGTTAAFTAAALGGVVFLKSDNGQRLMSKTVRSAQNLKDNHATKAGADMLSDYFARNT